MKKIIFLAIFLLLNNHKVLALGATATAYKSGNTMFLYGLQPNSKISVDIYRTVTKAIMSDSCGTVFIKASQIFKIENYTVNPNSDLVNHDLPKEKNCNLSELPPIFKTPSGIIAITGNSPNTAYRITYPNRKTTRQLLVNDCGFIKLNVEGIESINLPTVTGDRGNFSTNDFLNSKPLNCVNSTLYLPAELNLKSLIVTSISINPVNTIPNSSSSVNSQTAQLIATKNGNYLIVSSVPPGSYTITNAAKPNQKKTYRVGVKSCFIGDITQIGTPSNILISRQGLTLPISWKTLRQVSTLPNCN